MSKMQALMKYRWGDTPDNEDALKKSFYLAKTTGKWGFLVGLCDICTDQKKTPYLYKAYRIAFWTVPMVGMSTAFTVTQQVSSKLFPTIDPEWHWCFGGAVAGGIGGAWAKCGVTAFVATLFGSGLGFAYKHMRECYETEPNEKWKEMYSFGPEHPEYILYERRQTGHWITGEYDWRLFKQKERGHQVHNIA